MPGLLPHRVALLSLLAIVFSGCAHHVTVTSNVPDAEVRVDGVDVGKVKDGATFPEHPGFLRSYDIEVSAPGHHVERRQIVPRKTDPWRGVPAMFLFLGSCSCASCLVPGAGLTALLVDNAEDQTFLAGVGATSVALLIGSAAIAAYGIDELPDTINVDLEPDETAMVH